MKTEVQFKCKNKHLTTIKKSYDRQKQVKSTSLWAPYAGTT